MAMIFDAFAGRCSELLGQLIQEEVVMILGVKDDLRRLQEKLKKIKNVLSDAERRRIQDATTNDWLSELKDVMYDADDIIDLCRIKGRQLLQGEGESRPPTSSSTGCSRFPFLSCFTTTVTSIPLRHEIGEQIRKLSQRLEEIYKDRQMFSLPQSGSPNVVAAQVKPRQTYALPKSNVVGRKTKSNEKKIAESLVKSEDKNLLVFAITGLGGIGKTTLAQKIYNNQKVEAHFGRKRIWVKQIIRSAGGEYGRAEANAELQPILTSTLAGSRFLLVLDDLWRADLWTDLLQAPLEHAGFVGIGTRSDRPPRFYVCVRTMKIWDSSRMLEFVEKLDTLQTLILQLEDEWTECLPEWLLGLVQQAKVNGELEELSLFCSKALAKRCIMGGEYWPLLNHIPDFSV